MIFFLSGDLAEHLIVIHGVDHHSFFLVLKNNMQETLQNKKNLTLDSSYG